jgi:hypothetical protein
MTLDEEILRDVETARDRLETLEDEAYEARAALHQAIRRLHATGGSMREIATALGMSHQRVHQIIGTEGIVEVEPSAVTEVNALPSTSTTAVAVTAGEDACSFCGAPRRELDKLLAAPGPVFICGQCIVDTAALIAGKPVGGNLRLVPIDEDATCSFCGNASAVGGVMAEHEQGSPRICARCTETCRRLTDRDEPRKPMMRRSSKIRCSFCNVSQTDTKKLIAGPGVYICEGCVAAAGDVVATATPAKGPRQVVLRPAITEDHPCSFCGKAATSVRQLAKGGRARICDECVQLCSDIVAEG